MTPSPAEHAPPVSARADLDRRLISGIAWTAVVRWSAQILTWGSMLLLARLLSPTDFGILGMSTLFLGFIAIVSEFGIGSAIIVMRELSEEQIRQMHGLSVLLGFCAAAATSLTAKPVAAFFHNPALQRLIPVMGLGFAVTGLRVVPQALLLRDLRFKLVSGVEAGMSILQAAVSVVLAWAGMHYWSMALSGLFSSAVASLFLNFVSRCGIARPVFRQIRGELRYSWHVLVSGMAWYLYSNSDFVVAGRLLGASALGVYNMAFTMANVPVERIGSLVGRVSGSVFSNIQHDCAELRRYLRVLTEGMSLVVFPIGFGVALVADSLVAALFDPRWAGVAMPLRLLALYAMPRCLCLLYLQVQNTIRDVRFGMWQSILNLIVFPPAFWYASRWGGAGIAAAWLCLYPVLNVFPLLRLLRRISMPKLEYLDSVKPAGVAVAIMVAAVLAIRPLLPAFPPLLQLIVETALGAAVYAAVLFLCFRRRAANFVTGVLRRRTA